MLSTIASLIISASAFGELGPFLMFSKAPALASERTTVEIGQLVGETVERDYWLRRSVHTADQVVVHWTDTKRCPPAKATVEAATSIPPPQIWIPGVDVLPDGGAVITADGVSYEITVGAHYEGRLGSDLHFTSNVRTPLANWVEESLRILEACWTEEPPTEPPL